jgi:hypothetical protein
MKTGRDADRPGLYISECCLSEAAFRKGQTLTRCPACNALTVWEIVKPRPASAQVDATLSKRQ